MALFKETRRAEQHEAELSIPCVTRQGIPLRLKGTASYTATNRMDEQVHKTLAWYLEAIVRGLTVEELVTDRRTLLTDSLITAAGPDLARAGVRIVSVEFHEIEDPTQYLRILAAPHIETIRRYAREATALANQRAAEAEAERIRRHDDAIRAAEAQRRGAQGDQTGPAPKP